MVWIVAEAAFALPRISCGVVLVSEMASSADTLLWELAKRPFGSEAVATFARSLNKPGAFYVRPVRENQIGRHGPSKGRSGVVAMTEEAFAARCGRMLPRSQTVSMARTARGHVALHKLIASSPMLGVALPAPASDGFVGSQRDLNRVAVATPGRRGPAKRGVAAFAARLDPRVPFSHRPAHEGPLAAEQEEPDGEPEDCHHAGQDEITLNGCPRCGV